MNMTQGNAAGHGNYFPLSSKRADLTLLGAREKEALHFCIMMWFRGRAYAHHDVKALCEYRCVS